MGVDYSGHYGIGFKVLLPELPEDHEFFEDERFWLDDIIEKRFDWFEVGEGMYTGEDNEIYICIKDPFENGLDITEKTNELISFLNEYNIKFEGDINEVGGLEVY